MNPGGAVCSDLHLDAVTDRVPRFAEISGALGQVEDYVLREDLSFLAILGDISNPGPGSYAALHRIGVCAQRIAPRALFLLRGNHDLLDDGERSILEALLPFDNVVLAERPMVMGPGIVGIPYPSFGAPLGDWRAQVEQALSSVAVAGYDSELGAPIVFGHLDIESTATARGSESKDFARGRDVYWPIDLIRKHLPGAVCIGGHLHRPQYTDGVFIVGSLARLRHDEEGNDPSFLVVRPKPIRPADVRIEVRRA